MEGTNAQLSALLAAWTADIAAEPFQHERALRAFARRWAYRQRFLARVHELTSPADAPPA